MNLSKNPCGAARRRRESARGAAALVASLPLMLALSAHAQYRNDGGSHSLLPYTASGYVGANVGMSDYHSDCFAGFDCDDTDRAVKVYTGGMVNDWLGAEIGYHHLGTLDRNGGTTRAHGINASLVGNLPFSDRFMVYGKLGLMYGRTLTSAAPGLPSGTGTGWGPSWGLGAGFSFTPQWAVVLDWDQHRFEFPSGKDYVSATTVGLRFRF